MLQKSTIIKSCEQHGFYRTPHLNDRLYLHFKGISDLGDSLEDYSEVRVLWLEGNCLTSLRGFEKQRELRQLYLHQNMIERISGLDHLVHLVGLNLSDNFIKVIEGLECLPNLQTLQLKGNRIENYEDFVGLQNVSDKLSVLDLTGNRIKDARILDVLKEMPSLACLYLHQNPVCGDGSIKPYRKLVVGQCTLLRYLDDRPVFEHERRTVNAWMKGGTEAEKSERKLLATEDEERREKNFKAFQDLLNEAKAERRELGEQLEDDTSSSTDTIDEDDKNAISEVRTSPASSRDQSQANDTIPQFEEKNTPLSCEDAKEEKAWNPLGMQQRNTKYQELEDPLERHIDYALPNDAPPHHSAQAHRATREMIETTKPVWHEDILMAELESTNQEWIENSNEFWVPAQSLPPPS